MTVDSAGNLWVPVSLASDAHQVKRYSPGALTPSLVVIWNNANFSPDSVAVLGTDLYVADSGNQAIVKFAGAAALSGTQMLSPTAQSGGLNLPRQVAFDSSGLLWSPTLGGNNIFAFNTSLAMTRNLIGGATNLFGPASLAFDAAGNLWTGNAGNFSIFKFITPQITGDPINLAPTVTLSGFSILVYPSCLAFDGAGNLWVADSRVNAVEEFPAVSLVAGGTPTPIISFTPSGFSGTSAIAISP